MADILDAAQSNTPAPPPPAAPMEPPPPPIPSSESMIPPAPPATSIDSLIIPPPEPPLTSPPPPATEPPPEKPKKKSRLGVLIAGLLILAITIPILTVFVRQQVEIRSRAATFSGCTGSPPPNCYVQGYLIKTCNLRDEANCKAVSACGCTATYSGGTTPTPPTPGCKSNGSIVSNAASCCSGYASYQGSSLTCGPAPSPPPPASTSTPTPAGCKANGLIVSDANSCCSGYAAYQGSSLTCGPKPIPTQTCIPDGQCMTSSTACCGSSYSDTSCGYSIPVRCGTSCKANGLIVSDANSCCSKYASYQGSSLTCGPMPTSTPVCKANGLIVSDANSCCSKYASYQGSSLTCGPMPTSTPVCKANGLIVSDANSCCSKYASYQGSSLTCGPAPTTTGTPTPYCIFDNYVSQCVGTELCDVPVGEMGWLNSSCNKSGANIPSCALPYYCTSNGTCIKNGTCTPTGMTNKNCHADVSCGGGGANTPTPTPSQCINIIAYKDGNALSTAELTALHPGDMITLAFAPGGAATKVHLRVNAGAWNETSNKNTNGQFIWNYTLENVTSFTIEAQWFDGSVWN